MPPNMGMPLAVPPPNLMGLPAFPPAASTGLVNSIPLPSTPAQDKTSIQQLGGPVPPLAMVPPTSEATLPGMSEALLRVPFGVPPHIQAAFVQQEHAIRQANMAATTIPQSKNSPAAGVSGPSSVNRHDDNMDIDMDDEIAKNSEKPANEQLLPSFRVTEHNIPQFPFPPPPPIHSNNKNPEQYKPSNFDKKHDDRGRARDRDRGRDKDHNNDRDRIIDRRSGRWQDDEKSRGEFDNNDKPEKSLQERLRDLAKESPIKNLDRDDRFERRDRDRRRAEDLISPFNINNRNTPASGGPPGDILFSDMDKKGPLLRDPLPFGDMRGGGRGQYGDRDLRPSFPDNMRDGRQFPDNCRDNRDFRIPFQDGFDNRDRRPPFVDREPVPLFPNDLMEMSFNERDKHFRDIDGRHGGMHYGDNMRDMGKPHFPEIMDRFDYPDDMIPSHARMRSDEMDMYEYEMRREGKYFLISSIVIYTYILFYNFIFYRISFRTTFKW